MEGILERAIRLTDLSLDVPCIVCQQSASFWVELLGTQMPELLQDPLPFVRCSACDCMSLIGEQTFVELPVRAYTVSFQTSAERVIKQ